MKPIDQQVQDAIQKTSDSFGETQKLKEFQKTLNDFNTLVEKGLVKHRGNNSASIEKAHLQRVAFNTK